MNLPRGDLRGALELGLMFLFLLLVVMAVTAGLTGLAGVPPIAWFHNHVVLWFGMLLHSWEGWLWWTVPPLVLVLGSMTRSRWTMPALCLFVVVLCLYLFLPWGLVHYAPAWRTALLLSTLVYLLLRWQWARWTVLYDGYCWMLRAYLEAYPRGEHEYALLDHLRTTPRSWDRVVGVPPTYGQLGWWLAVPRRALLALLVRFPVLAALRRKLHSDLPTTLTQGEPLWYAELQARRNRAETETHHALLGGVTPPDTARAETARRHFRDWLATTDALVECCLFNLSEETPGSLRDQHLLHAADFCSQAASRISNPPLIADPDDEAVLLDWFTPGGESRPSGWPGDSAWKEANRWWGLERRCLRWLVLGSPDGPVQRSELLSRLKDPNRTAKERLRVARLLLVEGQLNCESNGLGAREWEAIADVVADMVPRELQSGADGSTEALTCRRRFLAACADVRFPQVGMALEELHDMEWQNATGVTSEQRLAEQRADALDRGRINLLQAYRNRGPLRIKALESALLAFRTANHPCSRWLSEWVEHWQRNERRRGNHEAVVADRLALARPTDTTMPAPANPDVNSDQVEAAQGGHQPWTRRPPALARWVLVGVATVLVLLLGFLFEGIAADSMAPPPDLRVGQERRQGPIQALARGPHSEPAIWLGTEKEGVHVKPAGNNHHWYSLRAAPGQLPSDDVRRIHINPQRVAFAWGREGRVGLTLARPGSTPGTWPFLGLSDWTQRLELTRFGLASDVDLTALWQDEKCPVLLVGTQGRGLGRYHVVERRWLDPEPLETPYLPPLAERVNDLVAEQRGETWHAWLATPEGITQGAFFPLLSEDWVTFGSDRLIHPDVRQLTLQPSGAEARVLYRTATGGLGRIAGSRSEVLVSDNRVADLNEASLRRVAYGPGKRVWLLDQAETPRIHAYREGTHEWSGIPLTGDIPHDMAVGQGEKDAGRLYVGTDHGLLQLTDSGERSLRVQRSGDDLAIHRVAPAPGAAGVAVLAKTESGPGVLHTDPVGSWGSLVGPGRIPGLTDEQIRAVLQATPHQQYLGTESLGLVSADLRTREMKPAFPGLTDTLPIRDLVMPPPVDGRRWLVRVQGRDQTLEAIDLEDPRAWRPLLGKLQVAIDPDQIVSVKAYRDELYVASADRMACYDMRTHRWTDLPLPQVKVARLVAVGRFWLLDRERKLWLFAEDRSGWGKPRFEGVQTLHAGEKALYVVVEKENTIFRVLAERPDGEEVFMPRVPLPMGTVVPRLATVSPEGQGVLYAAPVSGELPQKERIGRYDLGTRTWTSLPIPNGVQELTQLQANKAGVWVVGKMMDQTLSLFLSRDQQNWSLTTKGVALVSWDAATAVVLLANGEVLELDETGKVKHVLVGAPFQHEGKPVVLTGTVHAAEFDGDLFVACGPAFGRYRMKTHSWMLQERLTEDVVEMVPTGSFLYVRTKTGVVHRLPVGGEWDNVSAKLLNQAPALLAGGITIPDEGVVAQQIVPLGQNAVGILASAVGTFAISDEVPNTATALTLRTLGVPDAATISAACDLPGELVLGTDEGVWAYHTRSLADGTPTPPLWQKLPLPENLGMVRQLLPGPDVDGGRTLIVHGEKVVARLRRKGGPWQLDPSTPLNLGTPLLVAVAPEGIYLGEGDPATGVADLAVLDHTDLKRTPLVRGANPHTGAATHAVAADPQNPTHLYRADVLGRLARYIPGPNRFWEAVPPLASGKVEALYVAGGNLWAWFPQQQALCQLDQGKWQQLTIAGGSRFTLVVPAEDGSALLVQHENGTVSRVVSPTLVKTVLPAGAQSSGLAMAELRHALELGDWLILAGVKTVRAYHIKEHRWQKVADLALPPREAVEIDQAGPAGPLSYWLRDSEGKISHLSLGGNGPEVKPVDIKGAARRLCRIAEQPLAVTEDSRLIPLSAGQVAQDLLTPRSLAEKPKEVELRAAIEWSGLLLLSYGTPNRAVVYDPARMEWWSPWKLPQGDIVRFHALSGANPTLFAEVVRAGPTTTIRSVVELRLNQATRQVTPGNSLDGIRDVTAHGSQLWLIDGEGRLRRYDTLAKQPTFERLAEADEIPNEPRSAVPCGRHLLILDTQGKLQRFDLETLRWTADEAGRTFLSLAVVNSWVFAIDRENGDFYRFDPVKIAWQKMPEDDKLGVGIKGVVPGGQVGQAGEDQRLWRVQRDEKTGWTFEYRDRVGGEYRAVRLSEKRFDLNRYEQLHARQGVLWTQTQTEPRGRPVWRRFDLTKDGNEMAATERFAVDSDSAKEALRKPSPLAFKNQHFWVEEGKGDWTARTSEGAALACAVYLLVGDRWRQSILVADGLNASKLDLDDWQEVVGDLQGITLITRAGPLRCKRPVAGAVVRQSLNREVTNIDRVIPDGGAWLARRANDHLRSQDGGLTWQDATGVGKAFEAEETLLFSNRHLNPARTWKVTGTPQAPRLGLLFADGFHDVKLTPQGFGFDQFLGLRLNRTQIEAITWDGRLTVPLDNNGNRDDKGGRLDPATVTGLPADLKPGLRLLVDPKSTNELLWVDEGGRSEGLIRGKEGWLAQEPEQRQATRSALRATLWKSPGGEWFWPDGERPTLQLPFLGQQPYRATFDPTSGRFCFDNVRAIQVTDKRVEVASDAGVHRREKGEWTDLTVPGDPFGRSVQAEFVAGFLEVRPQKGGATTVYGPDGKGNWKAVDAEKQIAATRETLVAGPSWILRRSECGRVEAGKPRRFGRQVGGRTVSIPLAGGLFETDQATCLAGSLKTPVIGTPVGLRFLGDGIATGSAWKPVLLARPVVRLGIVEDALQVATNDEGEELRHATTGDLMREKEVTPFAVRDRTRLQGTNWIIKREGEQIQVERLFDRDPRREDQVNEARRAVLLSEGRFDFDRVVSLVVSDSGVTLATDHGFLFRARDGSGRTIPLKLPRPNEKPEKPKMGRLWLDGEHVLVSLDAEHLYRETVTGWVRVDAATARHWLPAWNEQVTWNPTWDVREKNRVLSFRLRVFPRAIPQVVPFDAGRGGFLIDHVNDLVVRENTDLVTLATGGGVSWLDTGGGWQGLRTDLDPAGPVEAVRLWLTSIGLVVRPGGVGGRYLKRFDDGWEPRDDGVALVGEAEAVVDADPSKSGWGVRQEGNAFVLRWRGEPVGFSKGTNLRFLHDCFQSATWHDGALCAVSSGGVLAFALEPNGTATAVQTGLHLTAGPILDPSGKSRCTPFLIRSRDDQLWCRSLGDGNEEHAVRKDGRWKIGGNPTQTLDDLGPLPGLGRWKMPEPGRVRLACDAVLFPHGSPDKLMEAGTFIFWNLQSAIGPTGNAVVWSEGWVLATGAGTLHLDEAHATRTVEVKTADGTPLEAITEVRVAPRGGLFARNHRGRVFSWKEGAWHPTEDRFPEHEDPVESGWLRWTPGPEGVKVTLREGETATGPLLRSGRFAFDEVRSVAWHDGAAWLVTAAGVVRVDETGAIQGHHQAGAPDQYTEIRQVDGLLYAFGPGGNVRLREDGFRWKEPSTGAPPHLRRVAKNELFEVSRAEQGKGFEVNFLHGDRPRWKVPGETALLQDGVWAFDDWSDVALFEDSLVATTRMGAWVHRLDVKQSLGPPLETFSRGDLLSGSLLVPHPEPVVLLPTKSGWTVLKQQKNGWSQQGGGPETYTEREFRQVGDSSTRWRLALDPSGELLWVEKRTKGRSPVRRSVPVTRETGPTAILGAFDSPTSLWVPVGGQVLWIRKNRF